MKVLSLADLHAIVTRKAKRRERFVARVQATLRELAEEAKPLHPFDSGTFFDQLRYEVNTLRVEYGDEIMAERRKRQTIGPSQRSRIYKRDGHACVDCKWKPPRPNDTRKTNRWLTIGHIIPHSEGGTDVDANLKTQCNLCNAQQGKTIPRAV